MWIHEGFTSYTESVYVECQYGYEKGQQYINGCKENIDNTSPIMREENRTKGNSYCISGQESNENDIIAFAKNSFFF
jgi:hypothetical protein